MNDHSHSIVAGTGKYLNRITIAPQMPKDPPRSYRGLHHHQIEDEKTARFRIAATPGKADIRRVAPSPSWLPAPVQCVRQNFRRHPARLRASQTSHLVHLGDHRTFHHGAASTSGASHSSVLPVCSSSPARAFLPYSVRNVRRCVASASRGRVVDFTSIGSSLPPGLDHEIHFLTDGSAPVAKLCALDASVPPGEQIVQDQILEMRAVRLLGFG